MFSSHAALLRFSAGVAVQKISHQRYMQCHCLCATFLFLSLALTLSCARSGSDLPQVKPQDPNVISLEPQHWDFLYSNEVGPHPSNDPEGAWSFEFPQWNQAKGSQGHVNYLQTPFEATTKPSFVTITFKVESTKPQYVVFGDKLPATFELFFEQKNAKLSEENGRWWAPASKYDLGPDDEVRLISVPLTPDHWTNVNGKQDAKAFAAALANVGWFGLTFGGQSFAGHGVALNSGRAKFILIDYEVE